MDFDHDILDHLRRHYPAWRLLRSDHAALIASFLQRAFIAPNERMLAQNRIVDLGLLRRMKTAAGAAAPEVQTTFEVRRILKTFVDAEWLAELDARLAAYQAELDGREDADREQE